MGSTSSRLRKNLLAGDEVAALHLYQNNADLRKALDPNQSYGETHQHNTPLHFAAKHAMKSLVKIFLNELGGNPNKKNTFNETSIHLICKLPQGIGASHQSRQRRYDCLLMMLKWRGSKLGNGQVETVVLDAEDEDKNTALHYAAQSGMKLCVELLVDEGSPLYTENSDHLTPCDTAEQAGHSQIALYLESKMVFAGDDQTAGTSQETKNNHIIDNNEGFTGLRAQDLQEAKDHLLVETSDMLQVPLFTAEALLRNFEWSRELLLDEWIRNPTKCCENAGVSIPVSVVNRNRDPIESTHSDLRSFQGQSIERPQSPAESILVSCDICLCHIPRSSAPLSMSCDHIFCRACWEGYLNLKIQEGDAHNITCPGYDCSILVPVEFIEVIVSRDMARRYLQFDIKAFVDSNPHIKWCPFPGCGRAVKLPDSEASSPLQNITTTDPTDTSRSVDCGNGHYFCWDCGSEGHAPSSCENWQKWLHKIAEVNPAAMGNVGGECESAANVLWLVTNSKRCPNTNCQSPIQKNEGCNHMKCSKCKYDFCWVCLEPWKKHSSATGGYFRCNRYDISEKAEKKNEELRDEAKEKHKKIKELNKFVHYYTRFKNHENSFKLEEPLLSTAKEKMLTLAKAINDSATAEEETQFVEDAVQQLLKARLILKYSYVYGYYMDEVGYKKKIFESMQTELEESTESLSQMVARSYLRTPRVKIIDTAQRTGRKRHDLLSAIMKGLIPIDYSPDNKRHYSLEMDANTKQAILASLEECKDLKNPWFIDKNGRHTNMTALLVSDDEDDDSEDSEDVFMAISPPKNQCSRPGCHRSCQGTVLRRYCSKRCLRMDRFDQFYRRPEELETQSPSRIEVQNYHPEIEFLRGLELSRIQQLQELRRLQASGPPPDSDDDSLPSAEISTLQKSSKTPNMSKGDDSGDFDLLSVELDVQRAIELSQMHHPSSPQDDASLDDQDEAEDEDEELAMKRAIALSLQEDQKSETETNVTEGDEAESSSVTNLDSNEIGCDTGDKKVLVVEDIIIIDDNDTDTDTDTEEEALADDFSSSGYMIEEPLCELTLNEPHSGDNNTTTDEAVNIPTSLVRQVTTGGNGDSTESDTNFGLLKNVSVNNIIAIDMDKTKDFDQKDCRLMNDPKKYVSSDEARLLDSLIASQADMSRISSHEGSSGASGSSMGSSSAMGEGSSFLSANVSYDANASANYSLGSSVADTSANAMCPNESRADELWETIGDQISSMGSDTDKDSLTPFLRQTSASETNSSHNENINKSLRMTQNVFGFYDDSTSGKKAKAKSLRPGFMKRYRHSSETEKDKLYRLSHKNEIAATKSNNIAKGLNKDSDARQLGDDNSKTKKSGRRPILRHTSDVGHSSSETEIINMRLLTSSANDPDDDEMAVFV